MCQHELVSVPVIKVPRFIVSGKRCACGFEEITIQGQHVKLTVASENGIRGDAKAEFVEISRKMSFLSLHTK